MNDNSTIAAISTAQGEGGIGVIRISGTDATAVADRVFQNIRHRRLSDMSGYTAAFGKIIKDGEELDEAVALVFRAPHSYTGEDVVELSCHGGIYITQQVLRAVLEAGAKPAQAGAPFSTARSTSPRPRRSSTSSAPKTAARQGRRCPSRRAPCAAASPRSRTTCSRLRRISPPGRIIPRRISPR